MTAPDMTKAEHDHHEEVAEAISDMVEEFDLPELADTMEEADARAAADRYLGAMRNVQAEFAANENEYKTLLTFQRRRHGDRQGTLERQLNWLYEAVKGLFGFMKVTGKKKSLNLLGGRVGTRTQQDELIVVDDAAVLEWAKETHWDSIVKTTYTLNRQTLRMYMQDGTARDVTKTQPPGVELKPRDDVFFATPATD